MRGLAKLLIFAAALAPAAAWAHCCCDHAGRAHASAHKMRTHHVERAWRHSYTVVTNRRCNNFPTALLRDGVSGVTLLDVRVGDDGWTRSVRIRRSSGHAGLDRASVACARGWYFRDGPEWQQARVEWWVG